MNCDCGRPGYKQKQHHWICQRCYLIESQFYHQRKMVVGRKEGERTRAIAALRKYRDVYDWPNLKSI